MPKVIQSVRFKKNKWTVTQSNKWMREHNIPIKKIDKTYYVNYNAYRQIDPKEIKKGTYTTKKTSDGVEIIFAEKK